MKKITIAIDGYSSCGKSTMAKDLAKEIGYVYVDTGAMYRSVTLYALRHQLFEADGAVKTEELQKEMKNISISFKFNETTGRPDCYLNGELVEKEIRSLEVSNHVSPIAAVPFVSSAFGNTVVPISRPSITMPLSSPIFCCCSTSASLTKGTAAIGLTWLETSNERISFSTSSPFR